MAAVNFCVRAFLPGPCCCFLMNVPFSFKASKASFLRYFRSFWLQEIQRHCAMIFRPGFYLRTAQLNPDIYSSPASIRS